MTTASGPRLLITECLPRPDVRGPDPLAVIHLTSADPVSAVGEHGKKPVLIAPNRWSVPIDGTGDRRLAETAKSYRAFCPVY